MDTEDFVRAVQLLRDIELSFQLDNLMISVDFINIQRFDVINGFDEHSHSNFEFHYIKNGKGQVTLSGREFVLEKGMFYLTGPGAIHKQLCDVEDPMVEYALKCTMRILPGKACNQNEENVFLQDILINQSYAVVYDKYNMDKTFEEILIEVLQKRPGYFNQIKNLVIQFINYSARNLSDLTRMNYQIPLRSLSEHRLFMVESYIIDNLERNISCKELASHVFLSEKQLNRIMVEMSSYPTHRFILNYRLKIAKELLEQGNMTLKEIAGKTGFSNEFHLSRCFKKHSGLSPKQFRDRGKN